MKKSVIWVCMYLTICLGGSVCYGATYGTINASSNDAPPVDVAARPDKDPLRPLDDLIAITEKNLNEQKLLRKQAVEYYKIKSRYLQDKQNKDLVIQMVRAAHQMQQTIESQRVAQLFDAELLEELKFFAKIAAKNGITSP